MITDLFATPILTELYEKPDLLNEDLLRETKDNFGFELFNEDKPSINTLKYWIKNHVDFMARRYHFGYSEITARQNIIKPFGCDTPHHHVAKSILVGVYYVDAPVNSGDILLQDPRGPTPWENLNYVPNVQHQFQQT